MPIPKATVATTTYTFKKESVNLMEPLWQDDYLQAKNNEKKRGKNLQICFYLNT